MPSVILLTERCSETIQTRAVKLTH